MRCHFCVYIGRKVNPRNRDGIYRYHVRRVWFFDIGVGEGWVSIVIDEFSVGMDYSMQAAWIATTIANNRENGAEISGFVLQIRIK